MAQELFLFEPLPIKRRTLQQISSNMYAISRKNGEKVTIEANTAYEAFNLCGIKDAIKIERIANIRHAVLQKKQFMDYEEEVRGEALPQKHDSTLLEKAIRERRQVLSPDDMIKIVSDLSNHLDKPLVSDPGGLERHNDGFDEIIPSNRFMRPLAKKTDIVPAPIPALEEIPFSDTLPQEAPEARALSQEEIEALLKSE